MSNKVYILLSALLVSATMVGLFIATSKLQENEDPRTKSRPIISANQTIKQEPKSAPAKNHDQSLTILNMWYDLAPDEQAEGVRLDSNVVDSRKIGIHSEMFSAIKPGYRVQLPNLIGDDYFIKLDKIERITDSEIQIYAELENDNETYYSTISIIDNTLLAVLSTPRGDYDLKMIDGKGVVYKSDDLNNVDSVIDQPGFLE